MQLLFIGAGNMGGAIIDGLQDSKNQIFISANKKEKIEPLKNKYPNAIVEYSESFNIEDKVVILAVKPQVYKTIKTNGKAKAIISVMAGVKLDSLREQFSADFFIRAMPNVAASHKASATAFTGDIDFQKEAKEILENIGQAIWVDSEKELNIATALAGSGPAYMMLVAEALADGAVRMGLKRATAQKLTQGLFEGSAKILKDANPSAVKDSVMSPAGTTAYGYEALEEAKVRSGFIKAVEKAFKRAEELS